MKILEPLVRSKPRELSRMSFSDYLSQYLTWSFQGNTYQSLVNTTMPGRKAESIANNFESYVSQGLFGNGVIFGLTATRVRVFSEARFQYQRFNNGRPGDLFGDQSLSVLEHPWPGGTTGDLLAVMLLHADFAGNSYVAEIDGQLVPLRPDWVEILLGERRSSIGVVGMEKVGYAYYEGGKPSGVDPVYFEPDEIAHFAPMPDPLASYRGMSWLTPVVREIQADGAMTGHKLAFTENAATPNLAVSLKEITDPDQFAEFVDKMDESHKGWQNAYKTLYLGAGADVTVIGANLQQLDFKAVQGAGETRLAQAAGVPPVVASLSEGMQGSSLNAGNFGQARRQFADTTLSHLWRNAAGSLEVLAPPPPGARLWYDSRDIPFLREDQKDEAEIMSVKAQANRTLVEAGWTPESVKAAIASNDMSLLVHSGLVSVQLTKPGSQAETSPTGDTPTAP